MQRVGLPRWLYLPAGVGALFVLLPLAAMVARVDWTHFGGLVTSASSRDALWLSLRTSAASTAACVVLGVPMAVVLARTEFRGQAVTRSLVLLPLVIPPVVSGIALLHTFGRRGLLGHTLDVLGVQVAFALMYTVIALSVLLSAVWIGINFANLLVAPIRRLIGAANLVFLPLATRLRARARQDALRRELVIDGVLALRDGASPGVLEERLAGYLNLKRPGYVAAEAA